jgi:peptide/nickel transport system ATP-binding protein
MSPLDKGGMRLAFVDVKDLKKYFPVQTSLVSQLVSRKKDFVKAVDGVDLSISQGEIYGLVGESGSGKTTTGRITVALDFPTGGKVFVKGEPLTGLGRSGFKVLRKRMQYIYQDPLSSMNPKMTVGEAVEEPLRYLTDMPENSIGEAVDQIFEKVGLSPPSSFYDRYPHELSGGQRQRVVIARALVVSPEYVVADEPVAMVDVSVRAQIMDLLLRMQKELHLTVLLITHDLAVAKYMCDRISVMYLGKVFETGATGDIFKRPLHPYTQALLAAVPIPNPRRKAGEGVIIGEIPSPLNPPSGCRFHPRCPFAFERCKTDEPLLKEREGMQRVACHLYDK